MIAKALQKKINKQKTNTVSALHIETTYEKYKDVIENYGQQKTDNLNDRIPPADNKTG